MPAAALAIRGSTVVTMDARRRIAPLDVLVDAEGRIAELFAPGTSYEAAETLDAPGMVLIPGLVQAHAHLCHTLFRGLAEDRPLMRMLRERIWPLEAAHDAASVKASASLGIAEMFLGGTTSVLDMGSVHHTDALFEAASEAGLRYTGGKALMDAGDEVPTTLREETATALRESDRLARNWHEQANGLLRYAYCPSQVFTATTDLLRSVAARTVADGFLVHTHASEQRQEVDLVQQTYGRSPIQLLADSGLTGPNACIAHCVWPESHELDVLSQGGATVVHCPSANMKLGSGTAPVAAYLDCGVNVALGTETAASHTLGVWEEMRVAGLLAKLRNGPEALPPRALFEMATLGGARALGLDAEIGSVETGKSADLVLLDLRSPRTAVSSDLLTTLVYAARPADVRHVLVNGKLVVRDGELKTLSLNEVLATAAQERERALSRAGITRADGWSDAG